MEKYKIRGVGLDTSQLTYRPFKESAQPYLYIELGENNGYLASGIIEEETQIIVGANFLDNLPVALFGLLSEIGRPSIDVLLVNSGCNFIDYQYEIKTILDSDLTKSIGIKQPESREDLERAATELKQVIIPKYVSLDISPLHFPKSCIDWAEENGLEILGFNPFGGYLTGPQAISSFGIPYLLSFAATYSEIVFLSSRDLVGNHYTGSYLRNLISREEDLGIYRLDREINSLVPSIPRMVYSGFCDESNLIPFTNSQIIVLSDSLSHSFSPLPLKVTEVKSEFSDGLISGVLGILEAELRKPDDGDICDLMSIAKPRLLRYISDYIGTKPYRYYLNRLDSKTFMIEITLEMSEKKLLGRDKKHTISYDFLFTFSESKVETNDEERNETNDEESVNPIFLSIETPIFK